MGKGKTFFTKNNPNYVGEVGGQRRMLASKKSTVKWY